jgi:hypothetical protein
VTKFATAKPTADHRTRAISRDREGSAKAKRMALSARFAANAFQRTRGHPARLERRSGTAQLGAWS